MEGSRTRDTGLARIVRARERYERETKEWADRHWKDRRCPICQAIDWDFGDIVELRDWGERAPLGEATAYPAMPIICGECGYTMLINAVRANVTLPPLPLDRESE